MSITPSLVPQLPSFLFLFFFFNDTPTTEIYTLSLHDALPIAVLDRIAAAVERALQADPTIGVAGHFPFPAVRLVDDRLDLLQRERRLADEVALLVDPGTVGHVDLDPVGALLELLAGRLARLDRAVDELRSLGHVDLGSISLQRIAAGSGDGAGRGEDARAGDVAAVDRLLDSDVAIAGALGLDVAAGGEALLQRAARRGRRP